MKGAMMIDDSPMLWSHWPHTVSPTQPFAYRDTVTLLRKLELLRENLDTIADSLNDLIGNHNALDDDSQKRFTAIEASVDNLTGMLPDMANLRDELISMIKQAAASDNTMVWSPAYGNQVPAQLAVEDTYDANRLFGLFAGDFDDLAMSPADFDALEVSPREFDLRSTDAINAVRGDITRNDIWWLKEHGLTFGDLIAMAKESATGAATSQTAAAQSATSAEQSADSASASQSAAAQSATSAAQSAASASASQSAAAQSATSAEQSAASASASQSAAAQSADSASASQTAAAQSATTATTAVSKMPTILTAANESAAMTLSTENPNAWVFYPEAA